MEFVSTNGFATGRTVAVQVKCGPSYFLNGDECHFLYYPGDKHINYWERYPLPVILMLHHPDWNRIFWVDARQYLRSPSTRNKTSIAVPKVNVLQNSQPVQIFETSGVVEGDFIPDLREIVHLMVKMRNNNGNFPISFFDLFSQGLVLIGRSLYFGMYLAINAAEANIHFLKSSAGIGIGSTEHDFLFDYVKFLIAQGLAEIDFADCLIEWTTREMLPHFVAPLTARGRALVSYVHEYEAELVQKKLLPESDGIHVCQEGFFEMMIRSYVVRLPRIHQFQNRILAVMRDRPAKSEDQTAISERKSD